MLDQSCTKKTTMPLFLNMRIEDLELWSLRVSLFLLVSTPSTQLPCGAVYFRVLTLTSAQNLDHKPEFEVGNVNLN